MKILKLRYKNINSLKGEHEINFSHACFKEGIFLITGVTGSGKSSLLDVISMALYAQTPRLKSSVSALMTQQARDSFCEVTFEVKGKVYRSRFSQYKKEKKFVSEMKIYAQNSLLCNGVTTVPSKVESLIGLNFKQFTQTMLLAQGEFDNFLKSDVQERALILEKMTDTAVYAEISKHVFKRAKEENEKLSRMKESLENVTLLEPQNIEELEKRKRSLTQEKNSFNLESLIHNIANKKNFEELQGKIGAYKKELESLQAELTAKQEIDYAYQKFLAHAKIEKAKISNVHLLDRELEFTQKNFDKVEGEFQAKEKLLDELKRKLESNDQKMSKIRIQNTQLVQQLKEYPEGEHLRQNYTHIVSKIHELEKMKQAVISIQMEKTVTLTEEPMVEIIALLSKKRDEFEQLFKEENLAQIEQQHVILEKKTVAIIRKKELEKLKEEHEAKENTFVETIAELQEKDRLLEAKKKALKFLVDELELKQAVNQKILNYEHDRSLLEEGCACPLCGSLEHPLFEKKVDIDEVSTTLSEHKRKHEALELEIKENQTKISELKAKLEVSEELFDQELRELSALRDAKGDLESMLKEQNSLNEKIQSIRYKKEEFIQTSMKLKEKEKELAELRLQIQKDLSRQEREEFVTSKVNELKYFLIKTLKLYGLELDGNSLMFLGKKKEMFEEISNTLAQLSVEIHPLESESIQIISKKNYLEESLFSDKKRISTQKCDLLMLNQKRFSIIEDKDIVGYAEKLDVKERKILKEWDAFNVLKTAFNEKKTLYFSGLEELEMKQRFKLLDLTSMEKEKENIEVRLMQMNEEVASISNHLAQDKEKRERFEKEEGTVESQLLIEKKWNDLNELIGSADGESYRMFAQSYTLEKLVELTNEYLTKLNHRYLLNIKSLNSLELEVVDLYQEESHRSVATLSSGESFMLSLALALGLSDLISNGVEINTLFLDEGFETLDEESLSQVMSTLRALEKSGRLIGIVSHLSELKESIPNQVQLLKSDNGLSQVSLVCG